MLCFDNWETASSVAQVTPVVAGISISSFWERFSVIGKILDKFKGSDFYMELDEDAEDVSSQVSQTAAAVAETVVETVTEVASDVSEKVEAVAEAAVEKAEPPKANAKKASKKSSKKSAPAPAAAPVAAAAPAAPAAPDPVDIIRAALSNSAPTAEGDTTAATPGNFATDYLLPTKPAPRRRPGPSLAKFKTMAKDYKR